MTVDVGAGERLGVEVETVIIWRTRLRTILVPPEPVASSVTVSCPGESGALYNTDAPVPVIVPRVALHSNLRLVPEASTISVAV